MMKNLMLRGAGVVLCMMAISGYAAGAVTVVDQNIATVTMRCHGIDMGQVTAGNSLVITYQDLITAVGSHPACHFLINSTIIGEVEFKIGGQQYGSISTADPMPGYAETLTVDGVSQSAPTRMGEQLGVALSQ